jgi:hypothetical protein
MRARGLPVYGTLLAVAAALTGCTAPAAAPLPNGITVEVHQQRPDIGIRQLQIGIHNDTGGELTVTRLEFDSPQFTEPVSWTKAPTTIRSGVSADLPVLLPAAACTVDSPVATVSLDYVLADGRSGTASAVPLDEFERMPRIDDEDCFAKSVTDVTAIEILSAPRIVELDSGTTVGQLDLSMTPTGATGSVTIDEALSTTLISQADAITGETQAESELDVTISGTEAPSVVTLTLRPGRCDAHAVAEDKRGTIFGLRVTNSDGATGVYFVTSPDDIKIDLYRFVQAVCAG